MHFEGMRAFGSTFRLRLWQVCHFWRYWPEIRWFFWGIRLRAALFLDRLAGRTPLLFSLTVWGHQQFIRPVMEELRKRPKKYSLYLILDQQEDLPEGDLLGVPRWRVRPYREYLPFGKYFAALLTPDIAERHPPSDCPIRIMLDHGFPAKHPRYTRKRILLFTHLFSLGPLHREGWIFRCPPELVDRLNILDVGYPKSDRILACKGQRNEKVKQFGLDPSLPTVLYAPAFNRGGGVDRYGKSVFDALAGMKDVNVLVKLHPVSYDRRTIGVHSHGIYWPDVVDSYCSSRFAHAGNVDVTDCLLAADVLVTDIGSIAFEYFLLDRPVVFLECPDFFRDAGVENGGGDNIFLNAGRPAGVEVGDMPSLCSAIRDELANPSRHSAARRKLAERLLYNPGRGTEACVEALEKLLLENDDGI